MSTSGTTAGRRRAPRISRTLTSPAAVERRWDELALLLFAFVIVVGGYAITALADRPSLPADISAVLGFVLALVVVAHIAVRRLAPRADATILPLVALLNGLGFVLIARLDHTQAFAQARWTLIGVIVFIATLIVVKRVRDLERSRYTFGLIGVVCLLLPLVPGLGRTINGARLWIRIGALNFQPAEIAKVLLVLFVAAYLVDKQDFLSQATRRVGRFLIPDLKHLAPLLGAWGVSILIMVRQKDLGSSLLFFAVFLVLVYMATGRAAYMLIGALLFIIGAVGAYFAFSHVQTRVDIWLDPWSDTQNKGFQIVQSMFAFGSGGFGGTGLGLGSPDRIPKTSTDFIFAAAGEELGIIGASAILIAFMLLVATGFRIALRAEQPFAKLFAAGLTAILGIQSFLIIGGVTRLIPLTGITLPFMSYGGSSLFANYAIVALLLRISDETERRLEEQVDEVSVA